LTPVGDADALADAMVGALDNPPAEDKLTARAGFFSTERAVAGYAELILGTLSRQAGGGATVTGALRR